MLFCTRKQDGLPDDSNHFAMYVDDFEKLWRMHPDKNVDLCVMPIAPMLNLSKNIGKELFYITFGMNFLPDEKLLNNR